MERDPERRITARAALLHPWLQQTAAEAEQPIGGQVVARLQRFSTYGLLKRSVLRLLGDQLRKDASQDSLDEVNSSGDVTGEYLDTTLMMDPTGASSSPVSGVLAEELERTSEFLELFDLLDTSGDALVEPEELEAGLRKVGYSITADECAQLLAQLDTTNDGFIDVNEFLAALVDWEALEKSSTEYPNWVAQAFNMLDKDGNGTIDAEEVAELVFMNGDEGELTAEAKKTVAACIVEADTDGDGLIDLDEFITLLQMDPTDQLDAYEWRVKDAEEKSESSRIAAVEAER
jgi:calcium-dependent protein kinase